MKVEVNALRSVLVHLVKNPGSTSLLNDLEGLLSAESHQLASTSNSSQQQQQQAQPSSSNAAGVDSGIQLFNASGGAFVTGDLDARLVEEVARRMLDTTSAPSSQTAVPGQEPSPSAPEAGSKSTEVPSLSVS